MTRDTIFQSLGLEGLKSRLGILTFLLPRENEKNVRKVAARKTVIINHN